ncbi:MAG: iron transporter FeoB [Firmicutes bacterium]|nr:iron transporter FeoB [Bacillota bacterium]
MDGSLFSSIRSFYWKDKIVVALVGNPNTGKSTLFNALTGLKQHTGNWPGKTVARAVGAYRYRGKEILLVALPGTYSLLPFTPEERVTRDFLCFGRPEACLVVVDAVFLERNLPLVLQILEIVPKTVVCLNLIDEAERKGISIDTETLADFLGVPVVPTAARDGRGLEELKETLDKLLEGTYSPRPLRLEYPPPVEEALFTLSRELFPWLGNRVNLRWIALCLLMGEYEILESARYHGWRKGGVKGEDPFEVLFGRAPSTSRRSAAPAR